MAKKAKSELYEVIAALANDVEQFYIAAFNALSHVNEKTTMFTGYQSSNYYWDQLPSELQSSAKNLTGRLLPLCAELADWARSSPLTGSEDLQDIKIAAKAMRAALGLRRYNYREADTIHDEGTVLGFRPAEQSEEEGISPRAAEKIFFDHLLILESVFKLIEASVSENLASSSKTSSEPLKYRTDTAFIMMWMDSQQPDLTDVSDAVKSVFDSFGIRALRADDIEHEGLITERVLNEIRTAEFLFADLTGIRPNVYYEIGFAHALGKRVILFRKTGTGLHFDLAGYNCPEYENLRDLREKLKKRLIYLTNRNPAE